MLRRVLVIILILAAASATVHAAAPRIPAKWLPILEEDRTLYELLSIENEKAPVSRISKHFRELARRLHPDKARGASEEEEAQRKASFEAITEAYDVLSDPKQRQEYDRVLFLYRRHGKRVRGATEAEQSQRESRLEHAYQQRMRRMPLTRVVGILVAVITVLQYAYLRYYRYPLWRSRAQRLLERRNKIELRREQKQLSKKEKRRLRRKGKDPDAILEEQAKKNASEQVDEITIVGAEPPEWDDMLACSLFMLPLTILRWAIYFTKHTLMGRPKPTRDVFKHDAHFEAFLDQFYDKLTLEQRERANASLVDQGYLPLPLDDPAPPSPDQ